MSAPHSSCRYAVIRGSLIGAPTGTVYSTVAVHEVWADGLLISQMSLGTPVTYSTPTMIDRGRVIAMLRNSADATTFAARLRDEDRKAQ